MFFSKMSENHFKKSEKTWDKIAKSFDTTRKKSWDICLDYIHNLPKDSIVADFGCGNGRHLIPCAKHCKKVYGIDISKELLKITKDKIERQNIKNVELIHSNLIEIPLEDNSVDSVIFIAALHNIKGRNNRIKALSELKRVLKKDKTAMISVWSRWQDKFRKEFFKKFFQIKNKDEYGDIYVYWKQHGLDIPRFYHLYSKMEFKSDIKKSGLKIIEINSVNLSSKKYDDNYFAEVRAI